LGGGHLVASFAICATTAKSQRPREGFYDLRANPHELLSDSDREPENIKENFQTQLRARRSTQGDSG
jgi:hypothetical protein